jgi:hypothetical protein
MHLSKRKEKQKKRKIKREVTFTNATSVKARKQRSSHVPSLSLFFLGVLLSSAGISEMLFKQKQATRRDRVTSDWTLEGNMCVYPCVLSFFLAI